MLNISQLIVKWERTGLLEGLPQDLRARVVLKYELAAQCVIGNNTYFENNFLHTNIFVIIYRIYRSGKKIGNVETFVRDVHVFFINNRETMQDLAGWTNVDAESEMATMFAREYKGTDYGSFEPLRWVNKHKFVKNEKPNNEEERDLVSESIDDIVINWWGRLKHFFCNLIKK